MLNAFILFEFWIEISLSKIKTTNSKFQKALIIFQFINLIKLLIFPAVYINYRELNPVGAFIAVGFYAIVFLKLFSYLHVNYQHRHGLLAKKSNHLLFFVIEFHGQFFFVDSRKQSNASQTGTLYPNNLTLKDLYYFMFAPTLCYELDFPRSPCIRKGFLIRRCGEILVLLSLQYCLGQQWMLPILGTIDRPLSQYSTLQNIERILRLAIPNHLLWLAFFYVYFHSTLNLFAELLCFGDRLFYRDWWNATDLHEFWSRWNTIVHDFCKRHIYKPLVVHYGFNSFIGSLVVFIISAFFHEVMLHLIRKKNHSKLYF